ncbi:MAG: PhzF family phenazine biosynthesis protein [Halioglobus sp.]|nr:PhzF family phenazine biosynthesis protein [Halioglobus sp.]
MTYPIYQVDAFTDRLFRGNPAAVMPLDEWLDDSLLQALAQENNLSETAFMVQRDDAWDLRWFTPAVEVDLCGHATLAAAHVLYEHLGCSDDAVVFHTRGGELRVTREDGALTLDFPRRELHASSVDVKVCDALGAVASEALLGPDGSGPLLCVYEFESDIAALQPDFPALMAATAHNVIVTAPGDDCDVVSRFFAPAVGVDEDPVTGSAHCSLVPYWAARLGRAELACRQISPRGGELRCAIKGDRVFMAGSAITFMTGEVAALV